MTGKSKMRIGWAVLGLAWVIIFAVMESYALTHADAITLSRFVYDVSNAWPPIVFLAGLTVGMLVSHFWWRWNPADQKDQRG